METNTTTKGNSMTDNKDWAIKDILIDMEQLTEVFDDEIAIAIDNHFHGCRIQTCAVVNERRATIDGLTQDVGDLVGTKFYENNKKAGSDPVYLVAQSSDYVPNEHYMGAPGQVKKFVENYWAKVDPSLVWE